MASFSLKHITAFLVISLITNGIHARESHFFSKVTKDDTPAATVTPVSTTVTNEDQKQKNNNNEPTFVPETAGDSYGLYGHETTTTTTQLAATDAYGTPYKTTNPMEFTSTADNDQTEKAEYSGDNSSSSSSDEEEDSHQYQSSSSLYNNNNNNNYYNKYSNGESLYSNNNYQQYNNNNNKGSYVSYEERPARSGGATYTTTTSGDDNVNSGALLDKSYNNVNQQQPQGLSDTRFMEGGKYFYDINDEQKYYPTYRYENSRSTSTNNGGRYYSQNGNERSYNANKYDNTNYVFNNANSVNTDAYTQNQQEFEEVQGELQP